MKTKYTVTLAMLTGFGLGAIAVQGLHAQAKQKAYSVTETQELDAAAAKVYTPLVRAAQNAALGYWLIEGQPALTHRGVVVCWFLFIISGCNSVED